MQRPSLSRQRWTLPAALAVAALTGLFGVQGVLAQSSTGSAGSTGSESSVNINPDGWCCPANPETHPLQSFECSNVALDDCNGVYADPLFFVGEQEGLCNTKCSPLEDPNYAAVCDDQNMETDKGEECEFNSDGSEMGPTCYDTYGDDYPNCDPASCLCVSVEPKCGNGAWDQDDEECDKSAEGGDYNGDGAVDDQDALCYVGGGAPNGTCKSNCKCAPPEEPECGDGNLDEGEDCDYSFCYFPGSPGSGSADEYYYITHDYTEDDCLDEGGSIEPDNGCSDAYHYCDVLDYEGNEEDASCVCTASDYCGDYNQGYDENGDPEECDDGNRTDGDGCTSNCKLEGCGDGYIEYGEECDDENRDDGDGCNANCEVEACGNGREDYGEDCEPQPVGGTCWILDANFDYVGDAPYTGEDGFLECYGYDDGTGSFGYPMPAEDATCNSYCQYTTCGNGVREGTEQCDQTLCVGGSEDGNEISEDGGITKEACDLGGGYADAAQDGDGCSANCKWEACGNYVEEPDALWPEACDDGGNCWFDDGSGDEISRPIDSEADYEMCIDPDGNYQGYAWGSIRDENDTCDEYCELTTCGNAYDQDPGEECDWGGTCVDSDGNELPYNGGSATVETYEEYQDCVAYDEGASVETEDSYDDELGWGCSATCKYIYCGNGTVEELAGEECDPGPYLCNCANGGSACTEEFEDEDGNQIPIDSQEGIDNCTEYGGTVEQPNYDPTCSSECTWQFCGDGVLNEDYGEECDDGGVCSGGLLSGWDVNNESADAGDEDYITVADCEYFGGETIPVAGDGCDDYCYDEICGNGYIDAGESCDNGYCSGGNYDGFYINAYSGDSTETETVEIDGVEVDIQLISYTRCVDGGGEAEPGELYGCSYECDAGMCGDTVEGPNEDCDDGGYCEGGTSGVGEVTNLTLYEQCIEGEGTVVTKSGDGCSEYCETEQCGNYELDVIDPDTEETEQCDDGSWCSCGEDADDECEEDGWDDYWLGDNDEIEGCEDVGGTVTPMTEDGCSDTCKLISCGNAEWDYDDEQCDDGGICRIPGGGSYDGMEVNSPSAVQGCLDYAEGAYVEPIGGDGCDEDCKDEVCGNKKIDPDEDCEDNKVYCDADGDGTEDSPIFTEDDYDACWRAAYDNEVYSDYLIILADNDCTDQCKNKDDKRYVYCCTVENGWEFMPIQHCTSGGDDGAIIGGATLDWSSDDASPSDPDETPDEWYCDALADDDDANDGNADSRCPSAPEDWQCKVVNEYNDCRSCAQCSKSLRGCTADLCNTLGADTGKCTFEDGWFSNSCKPNPENESCKNELCELSDAEVADIPIADCNDPLIVATDDSLWGNMLGLLGFSNETCIKGEMCIDGELYECADVDPVTGECHSCYPPIEDTLGGIEDWLDAFATFSPESVVFGCRADNNASCLAACGSGN